MTTLEAVLCAEVIAAQLQDKNPDADKLRFLRGRAAELYAFIDAQLESVGRAA